MTENTIDWIEEAQKKIDEAAPEAIANLAKLAKEGGAGIRARALKTLQQIANSNHPMAAEARKHLADECRISFLSQKLNSPLSN